MNYKEITNMKQISVVLGTRIEAIKMAPLVKQLRSRPEGFETLICVTAQPTQLYQVGCRL
jgi:UDP-N-acetylglucosamine 2-epimerase (non-hydrolysing)